MWADSFLLAPKAVQQATSSALRTSAATSPLVAVRTAHEVPSAPRYPACAVFGCQGTKAATPSEADFPLQLLDARENPQSYMAAHSYGDWTPHGLPEHKLQVPARPLYEVARHKVGRHVE